MKLLRKIFYSLFNEIGGLITKPNATSNGTTADGSAVSANFDTIYAEFNGNIDNNNIKANAGIDPTKLATITTAGKVSTSALTGTLSNAQMNIGTGANMTIALDSSSRIPAVDGSLITNTNASFIGSGTIPAARQSSTTTAFFSIAASQTYAITHNLGTTKIIPTVLFATDAAGTIASQADCSQASSNGAKVYAITNTTCILQTFGTIAGWNGAPFTATYARVILLAVV